MKSGILAAETIFQALVKGDFSASQLENYETSLYKSYIGKELRKVRNFHQAFQKGLWLGLMKTGFQYILGGRILKARLSAEPDFVHQKNVTDLYATSSPTDEQKGLIKFDGTRTFDKESDVYYSGTITRSNSRPISR
jgi:electron-transferring-flavoprotein dehydrogenase